VVVIHGAGTRRDEIAQQLGIPTRTITSPSGVSSVYTDDRAIDVFLMAYCGLVNKRLVSIFQQQGMNAVGLSGIDGKLWQAKRKNAVYSVEHGKTKLITDNLTGRVETINDTLVTMLLTNGYLPVLCPPAISFENKIVNTDSDWAVAMIAASLSATRVVSLFEAPGLLRNLQDESSTIHRISADRLTEMMTVAQGRMKKKVLGAQKALENGVKTVYWGDGRIKQPITKALEGNGTVIVASS
jgi:acetylglutamate/LysW-gamma-L-alpha-aminoadipate kinase